MSLIPSNIDGVQMYFYAAAVGSLIPIEQDSNGVIALYLDQERCKIAAVAIADVAMSIIGMDYKELEKSRRTQSYRIME